MFCFPYSSSCCVKEKETKSPCLIETALFSLVMCLVLKIFLPTSDIVTDGLSAEKAINLDFDLNYDFQRTAYGPTTLYIKFAKYYTINNNLNLKEFYDKPTKQKLSLFRKDYTSWIFGTTINYNTDVKRFVSFHKPSNLHSKFKDLSVRNVINKANEMLDKGELCHPQYDDDCSDWIYEKEFQFRYVRKIGYAMLIPLLLNFLVTSFKWLEYYKDGKTPRYTLIFVILQIWPQYNLVVIIKKYWKNKKEFENAKDTWERDIGLLEPMCESIIQVKC